MRTLAKDRAELIEALDAEAPPGGLTATLLEKDEHLTDALRALFGLAFEYVELVFCGGTSLSKAHGLIERMSEDADVKVVLNEAGLELSRTRLRQYLGDEVRPRVCQALQGLGLVEDAGQAVAQNEYRYLRSQWAYQHRYASAAGLRPNLQIELTLCAPLLPSERIPLRALADRLAGTMGSPFDVPTLSVAETQAEKVLSFLRRFALHRAGLMQGPWDTALVRHLYDVHCVLMNRPEAQGGSALAFAELVRREVRDYGRVHPDFALDPLGVLDRALSQVGEDGQCRTEYEQNLLPLVYGNLKPGYDQAFESFSTVSRMLLASARHSTPA